jgi:predicted membrane protein
MMVGLLLVLGGTLLFLDNLDILPFATARAFWPIALIAYSATFIRSKSAATMVWAATGILAGVLLLLGNYHVLRVSIDTLWPLLLIATGIVLLIYRLRWRRFSDRFVVGSSSKTRSTMINKLAEFAIFSSLRRKVETANFEGGELTSVFGAIVIDMRWAAISSPGKQARIEANAAFGSIELRIPETWRVQLQGSAVFGAYEDKTIPPRPEPGVEWPTLVVSGGTAFGAVEIRN